MQPPPTLPAANTTANAGSYGEPVSDVTGHLLQQILSNIADGGGVYAALRERNLALHDLPGMPDIYGDDVPQLHPEPTEKEKEYCLETIRALLDSSSSKKPQGEVIRSFFEAPLLSQDPPVGDRGRALLARCAVEELGVSRIVFSQLSERDELAGHALSAIHAQQEGVKVAQKVSSWLPISTPWSDEVIAAAEPVGTQQELRSGIESVYAHVLGYVTSTVADANGVVSHEAPVLSSAAGTGTDTATDELRVVGSSVARHPDLSKMYARPAVRSSDILNILNKERDQISSSGWFYEHAAGSSLQPSSFSRM